MHIKSALTLGLAGFTAAHSGTQFNSQQIGGGFPVAAAGKVYSHEYLQPNVEQLCFSNRPVASCDDQHVASYIKYQKVGFHCLDKSSPISKQFQREADQGQRLPLESKSQDVQAYVEVPTRCEPINTEEKRWRKETEKTSEQKIHLIQNQEGEEESFLFEHKPWLNELEQGQEGQEQKRLQRRNRYNQLRNGQNTEDDSESDYLIDEELDTMNQYGDLINNKSMTMHRVLKMKDDQFERFMEHLKFIVHTNRRSDKWSQQLETILPNVYSKVARQLFETLFENQTRDQAEKEDLYENYKGVVKRIYAFAIKEVMQMKQLNQFTGKFNERNQQYIINQIARNLWYKFQKELSPKQVQEVREIAEQIHQHKPQLDRMINEEALVAVNKDQMKKLEKDITKVLTAGLKMVNHNTASNQIENEEYKRYHGQDYEREFEQEYPKLFKILNKINKDGIQSQKWYN